MPKFPSFLVLAAALLCPPLSSGARCAPAADGRTGAPETAPAPTGDSAMDMHDVSPEREERYTRSVRQWLDSLPAVQQERARKILREARPGLHELRVRIREKKAQLAELRFSSAAPPDTLGGHRGDGLWLSPPPDEDFGTAPGQSSGQTSPQSPDVTARVAALARR